MDYFPQGQDLSYFPDFPLVQRFPTEWNFTELKMKRTRSADNNYVDSLLKYYKNELEDSEKFIKPLIKEAIDNSNLIQDSDIKHSPEEMIEKFKFLEEKESKKFKNFKCYFCGEKHDDLMVCGFCNIHTHRNCYEIQDKKSCVGSETIKISTEIEDDMEGHSNIPTDLDRSHN